MGVPLLLSWLKRYVGDCFIVGVENIVSQPRCDNLYIDLNSLLYQAADAVRRSQATDEEGGAGGGGATTRAEAEETERAILRQLFDILDDLVLTICRPRLLVYIAVDGVSPLGKMVEQRTRRLSQRRQHQRGGGGGFDANCFTCGTAFMEKIALALQYYCISRSVSINAKRAADGGEDLTFIVNDWTTPGEGEQKIFAAIRFFRSVGKDEYSPNTRHCIVSNDTDAIICSLPLHEPLIHVLQYDHRAQREDLLCFSIELFRRFLYVRLGSPVNLDDFERALHDIVFVLLLFGNDFLPKVSGVGDVPDGQLDRIVEFVASDLVTRSKTLVDPVTNQINFTSAVYLIQHLIESNNSSGRGAGGAGLQVIGAEGALDWGFENDAVGGESGGSSTKQNRHERSRDRSIAYWTMLQWAVMYCCSGQTPSWTASYPYDANDVPTLHELVEFCAVDDTRLKPQRDEPVSLYTQLLLLLPETSVGLLPASIQHEYQRTFKPILHQQSAAGPSITMATVEAVSREVARISVRLTKEEALRQVASGSVSSAGRDACVRLVEFAVTWEPALAVSGVDDTDGSSNTLASSSERDASLSDRQQVAPVVSAPKPTIFARKIASQAPIDLFGHGAVRHALTIPPPAPPTVPEVASSISRGMQQDKEEPAREAVPVKRATFSGHVSPLVSNAAGSRIQGVFLGATFHVPSLPFLSPVRLTCKFGSAACGLWTYSEAQRSAKLICRPLDGCTAAARQESDASSKRPRSGEADEEESNTAATEEPADLEVRRAALKRRIQEMRQEEALKQEIHSIWMRKK